MEVPLLPGEPGRAIVRHVIVRARLGIATTALAAMVVAVTDVTST
jgi:hypothetical protein